MRCCEGVSFFSVVVVAAVSLNLPNLHLAAEFLQGLSVRRPDSAVESRGRANRRTQAAPLTYESNSDRKFLKEGEESRNRNTLPTNRVWKKDEIGWVPTKPN